MGATVEWVSETRSVNIFTDTDHLSLTIGTDLPNGMGVPVIVNDRTFVPLSYVSDMLGASTLWDEATEMLYIFGQVRSVSGNSAAGAGATGAATQTMEVYIDRRAIEEIEGALAAADGDSD